MTTYNRSKCNEMDEIHGERVSSFLNVRGSVWWFAILGIRLHLWCMCQLISILHDIFFLPFEYMIFDTRLFCVIIFCMVIFIQLMCSSFFLCLGLLNSNTLLNWFEFNRITVENYISVIRATFYSGQYVDSSLLGQNGRHFADDIFICIFVNEKKYFV